MPSRFSRRLIALQIGLSLISFGSVAAANSQKTKVRPTQSRKQAVKPLTNSDIVRMVKNAFSEDSIISTIRSNKNQFNLSVDALIELKQTGVSERIISVMQAPQERSGPAQQPQSLSSERTRSVPQPVEPPGPRLEQPYVLVVAGGSKQALPLEPTHVGKAEAKGDSLGSLAKEQATDKLYNAVELSAATRLGIALDSRLAAIPLLGAAVGIGGTMMGGIGKLGRLVHKPKPVTYLWAVPGRSSSLGLASGMPQFEVVYGEIPGVDPDEYEPFIVRLIQTRENWRLVGAKKADPDAYRQNNWDIYSDFVEERIPMRSAKRGRGRYLLTLENRLEGGEYGVVLRPVVKSKIFSGDDIANRKNAGILFDTVWSFSLAQ